MCAKLSDVEIAVAEFRLALGRLDRALKCVPDPVPVSAEVEAMQRNVIIARTWPYDPRGLRNHIGPEQYAREVGL